MSDDSRDFDMNSMSADTGKPISGIDHLKQSIRDILSTPVGSRVMRRSYGSRVMYLLDQPSNQFLVPQIQGAVVEALTNFEPRIRLTRVIVNHNEPGHLTITLEGFYVPDRKVIRLENLTIQ